MAWTQGQVREVVAIEVYPALALLALVENLDEKGRKKYGAGYKKSGGDGKAARQGIWDKLKCVPIKRLSDAAPRTDHEIDAVLCVQIAHEFLRCKCEEPPKAFAKDALRREGWIWFSRESLRRCQVPND